jgi:hypothetical protein
MFWSPTVLNWSEGPTQQMRKFLDRTIGNTLPSNLPEFLVWVWPLLSPWLALFTVLAVHELGHVLVGMFTGYRFISIRVGLLQINTPFRVTWGRKGSIPGAAGFALMVPTHSRGLRRRAIVKLLAGPLANLASGLAVIFLAPASTVFSTCFVAFSIFVGLVNLIPFRSKAMFSDGKRILMLLRNSQQGERWLALMQIIADLRNGIQSDDLRTDFLAIATAVQDDSPDTVSAHTIAYWAAYYKHDDAEAARLLEVCLKYLGFAAPLIREAVLTDAVIFQARRRKRTDLAQQWLAEIPEKTIIPEHRFAADAAILEGQGDLQGALRKMDEAETVISGLADPIRRKLSLRNLQRARSELMGRLTATPIG